MNNWLNSLPSYSSLREQGICVRCKKAPAEEGITRCRPCADKFNEWMKARHARLRAEGKLVNRYQNFRAAGLCGACGKVPPVEGRVHCESCHARLYETHTKRRKALMAKGVCYECGASIETGRSRCPACAQHQKEIERARRAKRRGER